MSNKQRVLMVCLGNTCRSTIAEAVLNDFINKMALTHIWEVDSAGLRGYHLGQTPDIRAMIVLRRNGITNYSHNARVITSEDFLKFDWILAMDDDNITELNAIKPQEAKAQIKLLGEYDPNGERIINDPYCESDCNNFINIYDQCVRSIQNFLQINQSNSV